MVQWGFTCVQFDWLVHNDFIILLVSSLADTSFITLYFYHSICQVAWYKSFPSFSVSMWTCFLYWTGSFQQAILALTYKQLLLSLPVLYVHSIVYLSSYTVGISMLAGEGDYFIWGHGLQQHWRRSVGMRLSIKVKLWRSSLWALCITIAMLCYNQLVVQWSH